MTSNGKITKLRKMRESLITIALKSYLETLLKKTQKPTYVAIVMMKIFGNKICDKKITKIKILEIFEKLRCQHYVQN